MHFIITDKNDIHCSIKIKTGLNIGYFKIYKDINTLFLKDSDVYIRNVIIPSDSSVFYAYIDMKVSYKIIVNENKYHLYDPRTIRRFNINIMSKNYITKAFTNAHFRFFEFFKNINSQVNFVYYKYLVDDVSISGHVDVLEWLKRSGLPLSYSNHAMDFSTTNNPIDVLNWWIKSGLPLKYSSEALINASHFNNINLLEWWKNSGLRLEYDWNKFIVCGSDVVKWWENSGLPINIIKNICHYNYYYLKIDSKNSSCDK
uniref:Ankyrin repeat protein n=1 Tax=viral metagenome TaxID=1070528 RepID=A0A6C0E7T6_9ZZZZ